MIRLRVASSSDLALVGMTFAITSEHTRIGRGPDNDVVLEEAGLSRHHAMLSRTPSGYVMTDNGSANGLWVGEARVGSVELRPGVFVRIGGTVLVLEDSGAAATILLDGQGRALHQQAASAPRGPAPTLTKSSVPVALVIVGVLAAVLVIAGISLVLLVPDLPARIAALFEGEAETVPSAAPSKAEPSGASKAEKTKASAPKASGKEVAAPPLLALGDVEESRESEIDGDKGGEIVLSSGARLTIAAGAYVGAQTLKVIRASARAFARTRGFLGDVYVIAANEHARPSRPPRLEIPIDRAAFPDHAGPFAAFAVHADGMPYRVPATVDAERDTLVVERPAVHVLAQAAKRDLFGDSPPIATTSVPSTAFTVAPVEVVEKVTDIPCGKEGSVVALPKHVFRIHADVDTKCAHMKEVSEILQEAYGVYQREYKTTAGKAPFDGWLSVDDRMDVTLSTMEADFPAGLYSPIWGGGTMSLASATDKPDQSYAHELRVTLFHEMFHALQDMYTTMSTSQLWLVSRMWWLESTAEWAGRHYARRASQPAAMKDLVDSAYRKGHGTPYVLRFPIDESYGWRDGKSSYHYAMFVEFVENKSPGYVRKALNGDAIRGETLLASMYAAGRIETTYPEFVGEVMRHANALMSLDGKVMETAKQTRVWRRTGPKHDDELTGTPALLTEYDDRFKSHDFTAMMASATARFFFLRAQADAKPDVTLNVGVWNGEYVDHALIITGTGTRRIDANFNNRIEHLREAGDIWVVVFRPYVPGEFRNEEEYNIYLSLYLDCPRPGGVIIGSGRPRKTKETIEHEACYARNGYQQVAQADGKLKWVEIASTK